MYGFKDLLNPIYVIFFSRRHVVHCEIRTNRRTTMKLLKWIILTLLLSGPTMAAEIREERVQFSSGSSGTVITGTIKGEDVVDYVLRAGAGQRMVVTLETSNPSNYFNLLPADAPTALYNGSVDGGSYDGTLIRGGEYKIRVYLMRNAARRGETSDYTLSISIDGDPAPQDLARAPDYADGLSGGPDYWDVTNLDSGDLLNLRAGPGIQNDVIGQLANGDTLANKGCQMVGETRWCQVETLGDQKVLGWVSGRFLMESANHPGAADINQHSTGSVPCATQMGQPTGSCDFRAVRGPNGNASIWIMMPTGEERFIEFKEGTPQQTEAGREVTFERFGDLTLLRVGGVERYEVPDAIVYGH